MRGFIIKKFLIKLLFLLFNICNIYAINVTGNVSIEMNRDIDLDTLNEIAEILFDKGDNIGALSKINTLLTIAPNNEYLKNLKIFSLGEQKIEDFKKNNTYFEEQLISNYIVLIDYYSNTDFTQAESYISICQKKFPDNILLQSRYAFYLFQKFMLNKDIKYLDKINDIYIKMNNPSNKLERTAKEKTKNLIDGKLDFYTKDECKKLDIYEYFANKNGLVVSNSTEQAYNNIDDVLKIVCDGGFIYLKDNVYNVQNLKCNKNIFLIGNYNKKALINITKQKGTILVKSPCKFANIIFKHLINSKNDSKYSGNDGLIELQNDTSFYNCEILNSYKHGLVALKDGIKLIMNNCLISDSAGNGLFISSTNSNSKIYNCTFHGNKQNGVCCGKNSVCNISDSVIINSSYGIISEDTATVYISNCMSYGNSKIGIITSDTSNAIITNSISYKNNFSGFGTKDNSTATITNCKSYDNKEVGFVCGNSSKCKFYDCVSYKNHGGFASTDNSNVSILNCVTFKNTYSGFFIQVNAFANITNCISYENQQAGYVLFEKSNCTISNCSSYKNYSGFCINDNSSATIKGCKSYDNTKAGFACFDSSNCNIYESFAYNNLEGLVSLNNASAIINNCDIYNNKNGNILKYDNSKIKLDGKVF